ncbi:HpcH/HpaI aldolase/citrate lyase family protein [Natrarchaeobius halalkaliphilus]|nr:CoA ester lyase [Natrarchaeobius halalkaliphilus]
MTTNTLGLRRSLLAVPGNETDLISMATDSDADEIILDLEDSIGPNNKIDARSNLAESVIANDWHGKTISYRINDVRSPWWYDDIIEIIEEVGEQIDSLIIPKVEDASDLHTVNNLLGPVLENAGIDPESIRITAQIETAAGMNNASDIAHSCTGLDAMIFGPGDYVASIGASGLSKESQREYPDHYWHYPLSKLSLAASSADLRVIDGPYADVDDVQGFRRSCEQSRKLGYDGKIVVHPGQVDIANTVYSPSKEEAEAAMRIVKKYDNSDGSAPKIDGRVIDRESYESAKKIAEQAKRIDY